MKQLVQRLLASAEAKHFAMLTSATFVAQLANFAWTPFLARRYDPDAFGVMSVFLSVVSTVSLCASLRLEQAIVLAKQEVEASQLFAVCCALVGGCSAATFACAGLLDAVGHPVLVGLGVFASGIYQPLLALSTRQGEFAAASVSQVARVAILIAAQAAGSGSKGLITGYLAGEIAAGSVLAIRLVYTHPPEFALPGFRPAWLLIRRYRDFALYSAPQTLLNALSQNLPAYLLASWFGPGTAGAYWLAVRILVAPTTLAGFAFRQVYYEYTCRLDRNGRNLYPTLRSATLFLAVGSCACAVAAATLGPRAFVIVFGKKWLVAGQYVVLLAPWIAAAFANLPSVAVLPILGRQRFSLVFDIVLLVLRVGALGAGALAASDLVAVGAYSGVGTAANVILIAMVFRFVRCHRNSQARTAGELVPQNA